MFGAKHALPAQVLGVARAGNVAIRCWRSRRASIRDVVEVTTVYTSLSVAVFRSHVWVATDSIPVRTLSRLP